MRDAEMLAQLTRLARCQRFDTTSLEFQVSMTMSIPLFTVALMARGRSIATEWSIFRRTLILKSIQRRSSGSPVEKPAL